jgi:DNA-binding NarL/FixJ family response regulator
MEKLRILIADDHPLFRKGMRGLLESLPDMEVIGEAATGEEAIAMAADLAPDVIVMDLQMPGGSGISATRAILNASPHIRVLMVTLYEDSESVFTAIRAGARGYLLKDAGADEMTRAIQAVGRGEAIFSPSIANRLIDYFATPYPAVPEDVFPALTGREREILQLIAQGRSNAEMAQQLSLSVKTVQNYVSNIYSKLQVADRAEAIIRAREAGLK